MRLQADRDAVERDGVAPADGEISTTAASPPRYAPRQSRVEASSVRARRAIPPLAIGGDEDDTRLHA